MWSAIGCVQVVLRHGQLHMCRNQEMVRSGKDGRGLFIVINGLVRIGYRDPLGNTQEYFLGTGAQAAPHPCYTPLLPPCSYQTLSIFPVQSYFLSRDHRPEPPQTSAMQNAGLTSLSSHSLREPQL
jgi:hypothetical protein